MRVDASTDIGTGFRFYFIGKDTKENQEKKNNVRSSTNSPPLNDGDFGLSDNDFQAGCENKV